MKKNDKYLVLRGKNKDIYFIQKRVSKKVASIIGKDFIKKSLETDNIDTVSYTHLTLPTKRIV